MGHSTAEDIQEVLLRALEPLPLGKVQEYASALAGKQSGPMC